MAHNLHNGRMAYVGETPWHGLGRKVPPTVSAAAMIDAAGLAWSVHARAAPGARLIDRKRGTYDRYVVERAPIKPEQGPVTLGLVRSRYVPLQNAEAFAFFEPFIGNRWASFHTAGALGNGERVWVQAKLAGEIVIGANDRIDKFLLLSNSHDGSGAVTIRFTPVRVVCQNTLNLAMDGGSAVVSVRHTKNIAENLAKAQAAELKQIVDKVFAQAETLFGAMAARRMAVVDIDRLLDAIFPRTENQKRAGTEPLRWTRVKAILDDANVTPPATRDTIWALYNAIVRDEDYRVARETGARRLERVWFGSGQELKLKALNAARRLISPAA